MFGINIIFADVKSIVDKVTIGAFVQAYGTRQSQMIQKFDTKTQRMKDTSIQFPFTTQY
jgi:hypothetical protein